MNHIKGFLCLSVLLSLTGMAAKDNVITLRGTIEDSQCAYNVHAKGHTHDLMVKGGLTGADATEKGCTLHCVKEMGGVYVLLVKNDIYKFDTPAAVEPFSGEHVKITGTLDAKAQVLHIVTIERELAGRPAK
jgi:hypothetical protein